MPKLTKQVMFFEQLCKEIDLFKLKVEECDSEQQARVKILKSNVKAYEVSLSDSFSNFSAKENEDYIEVYLKYKGIMFDLLVTLEEKTEVTLENSDSKSESKKDSNVKNSFVKLPKFDLPKFYGESENWITFKELFDSTILKNEQLSKIEKLQYLQASVRSNAAKLIRGFPLKEEHLDQCWELLCERYENKRQLALSQINKIFSIRVSKANNSKTLLELLDTCNEAVRNLKTLGLDSNALSELMLINFMVGKLDEPLKQRWELTMDHDNIPDLNSFRKFVEREARSLEDAKGNKVESKFNATKKFVDGSGARKQHMVNSVIIKPKNGCTMCSQNHALFKCPEFNAKPVTERWKFVEINHLCQNCLRGNHKLETCRINYGCKNCAERHHTSLHLYSNKQRPERANDVIQESSVSNSAQSFSSDVLLSTALIRVKDSRGNFIQCRALVDNASQNSLITKKFAKRLNLPLRSTSHSLIGINCVVAETFLNQTEFEYTSHFGSELLSVNAFVVEEITSPLPNFHLQWHEWPHTKNLILADPTFYVCGQIEILLGAEQVASLFNGCPILGLPGTPTAFPTKIGYLLGGHIDLPSHSCSRASQVYTHAATIRQSDTSSTLTDYKSIDALSDTLQKFFQLESIHNVAPVQSSEDVYTKTVSRTQTGRYMVSLPFKETPNFGDSKTNAVKRFHFLESKLNKNLELKKQYHSFMKEYLELNHMELVPKSDLDSNEMCFYLPHHGVIKEDSSTTKLRVVFDGSAVASSGHSLNDFLEVGPKLQPDLLKLLLKFRSYPVALTADIEKMYRQILVNPEQVDFQRILWRFHPSEPISSYRLLTVTYGLACAPFLAIRTLHQLSRDYSFDFPHAARVIREDFFVDDLLTGSQSNEEAKQLVSDLNQVLNQGGFTLRKWVSNVPSILADLPEELKSTAQNVNFSEDSSQKILGLVWNSSEDTLKIHIASFKSVQTKRELLSTIARIFDPLGILAPTTIMLKIMMQELWKDKFPWDDPIPNSIENTWREFSSQIDLLKSIGISRFLKTSNEPDSRIQLHGFCDGSGKAYAAVIYLRSISSLGEISVNFVAAKTRVNPIKHVTLPRIELCAAFLLTQLCSTIIEAMPITLNEIFLWSDSQIVLNWINSPPSKGNQFVTNRATQIKDLIPQAVWTYVPSSSNPADCASRGIFPKNLIVHKLWWYGPEWLKESTEVHTETSMCCSSNLFESDTSEQDVFVAPVTEVPNFLCKYSSFSKLIRVTAFVHRFVHNIHNPSDKRIGALTAAEIRQATEFVVRTIQAVEFQPEISALRKNQPIQKASKFLSLNPFLDSSGILRVGGRLHKHQMLTSDQKHPMLLPKDHFITVLVIEDYHSRYFHAGPQLTLSLIRQKFWFTSGRSKVREVINRCLFCKKLKASTCQQIMGSLPSERIHPVRPFQKIGIDFCGPVITKPNLTRSKVRIKSYICVIICMCTKAVYIDCVSDLSTQALLACLRRFISRRGLPSDIYSDNGKNFVGLSNELKKLFKLCKCEEVQHFASSQSIRWHFIPPYTPNFGGIWESAVKSTKTLLVRACKSAVLNFEELTTFLCQIEALLNSRPLTPMSSDPSDIKALTPGHFLIGSEMLSIPESSSKLSLTLSERWRLLQKMRSQFWDRWSRDYLNQLQQRPKSWSSTRRDLQVGDLVVIHEPSSPPLKWHMGRVSQTFPGADHHVRVVNVKTSSGEVRRPISKVTLLLPGGGEC